MNDSPKTILLVEDELSMQTLFAFALSKEGFEVVKASNGKEALELLSEVKPIAIVSDIMMPELDGFGLREMLKLSPDYRDIPFLFLSAYNSEDNIIKGIDLEADDFVPKTDGTSVLVKKLHHVIRKRKAAQQVVVREMDEASRSTGQFLNAVELPEIPGYSIDHYHKTFKGVPGGDFIDYIALDNKMLAVLGDVMGKKWKAWVFAHAYVAYIRSSIRGMTTKSSDGPKTAAGVMNQLNTLVFEDSQVSQAPCAVSLIMLDPQSATINFSNALQYPLLHYKVEDGTVGEVQPETMDLLGLRPDSNFAEVTMHMAPGDAVVCCTDGISELFGEEDQVRGFELMKSSLVEAMQAGEFSAAQIVDRFLGHAGEERLRDDATLLIIRRLES